MKGADQEPLLEEEHARLGQGHLVDELPHTGHRSRRMPLPRR
jgi:hypothetical protein